MGKGITKCVPYSCTLERLESTGRSFANKNHGSARRREGMMRAKTDWDGCRAGLIEVVSAQLNPTSRFAAVPDWSILIESQASTINPFVGTGRPAASGRLRAFQEASNSLGSKFVSRSPRKMRKILWPSSSGPQL